MIALDRVGEASVQDYSLYIIARSGRLVREIAIDCADDDEAINLAEQWADDHDVELWQLDRMVGRFSSHFSAHGGGPRSPASSDVRDRR